VPLAIQQVAYLVNYSWALAILCIVGGGYTIYGGFKSVAYTDVLQVSVLILGGLIVTVLGLCKVVAFLLQDTHAIFRYIQEVYLALYPTLCLMFLVGFFYRRATTKGCLIAMSVVPTLAILYTVLYTIVDPQKHGIPSKMPFLNRAAIDGALAFFIVWIFRTRGDRLPPEATIDRLLAPEVAVALRAIPWYRSFRVWATLLVLTVYISIFF
jgi:Na+(H+)/acetate symporter ActP